MQRFSHRLFFFCCVWLFGCKSPEPKSTPAAEQINQRNDKDTFQLLCQYWQLLDAENPTMHDVAFTKGDIKYESGIVFMGDSSLLENPAGEMTYGKFIFNKDNISAKFEGGRSARYLIEQLSPDSMVLKRTEKKNSSKLTYKATHTFWKNPKKNPFAAENYSWVQKPVKPENIQEIKQRAKDFVQFYAYYFEGFYQGGAKKINFEALPSCFNWYQGGITIQSEKTLDKKWKNCFYSVDQANQARQILQDALLKKYDWDTTEGNWLKQTSHVLQQIHDGM